MTAQRDILNQICPEVAKMEGLVFELGLGNGRTFHHLRERLPGRRIVVFDREVGAHTSSIPDAENLVLGDIRETARRFIGIDAALVHADIGTGYDDRDAVTATCSCPASHPGCSAQYTWDRSGRCSARWTARS